MPTAQISFVHDNSLKTFDFQAPEGLVDKISSAFQKDRKDFKRFGLVDPQCYLRSFQGEGAAELDVDSASNIAEPVTASLDTDEDQDVIDALTAAADAFDEKKPGDGAHRVLVDFVWENGGDDDNAFSSSLAVGEGNQTEADAFLNLLERLLEEHNIAYDFTHYRETGEPPTTSYQEVVQEVWEFLEDLASDDDEDRFQAFNALKLEVDLAESVAALPAISAPRRPSL